MTVQENKGVYILKIYEFAENTHQLKEDVLAIEEPLEMSITYGTPNKRVSQNIAITMRTPGNDAELATGFLLTEGIIKQAIEVEAIDVNELTNTIEVQLNPASNVDLSKLSRHLFTSSSCGVCGKTSIDNLQATIPYTLTKNEPKISPDILYQLPDVLKVNQVLFDKTGGIHAAGLFGSDGNFIQLFEDVGRHNALDKLLGWALQHDLVPLSEYIIIVSGRASFELIQKALMAGCPVLAAVGAPSSLAVELANQYQMTLAGFVKQNGLNVYSGMERLAVYNGKHR